MINDSPGCGRRHTVTSDVSDTISTDTALCHYGFFLLQVGFTRPTGKIAVRAGSAVEIAAPGGSKMTIPQGLSADKSPWSSAPLKDLILQGIFARVGKKMKTHILLFFPPLYIHRDLVIQTIAHICQHRIQHHFFHSPFSSNTAVSLSKHLFSTDLLSSIILIQKYLKISGAASKAVIINLLTTSDTVFIRSILWGD